MVTEGTATSGFISEFGTRYPLPFSLTNVKATQLVGVLVQLPTRIGILREELKVQDPNFASNLLRQVFQARKANNIMLNNPQACGMPQAILFGRFVS